MTFNLSIHATVADVQGVEDLIGPGGTLENMPTRLIGHDAVISSGCHFHYTDDTPTEPDIDDRIQALIAYLGPERALVALEEEAGDAVYDAKVARLADPGEDGRAANREAGEKALADAKDREIGGAGEPVENVIRASNGDIVRRVPAGNDRFA